MEVLVWHMLDQDLELGNILVYVTQAVALVIHWAGLQK